ncbi:MAG: hypothetical protein JW860_10210 [Sedimentisphaerales bacterium]|nr:hypothetical protein [Sedimentisphaerales bacterium]
MIKKSVFVTMLFLLGIVSIVMAVDSPSFVANSSDTQPDRAAARTDNSDTATRQELVILARQTQQEGIDQLKTSFAIYFSIAGGLLILIALTGIFLILKFNQKSRMSIRQARQITRELIQASGQAHDLAVGASHVSNDIQQVYQKARDFEDRIETKITNLYSEIFKKLENSELDRRKIDSDIQEKGRQLMSALICQSDKQIKQIRKELSGLKELVASSREIISQMEEKKTLFNSLAPELNEKILEARQTEEVLLASALTKSDQKIKELEAKSRDLDDQACYLDEKAQQVQARCQSILNDVIGEIDAKSRDVLRQLEERTAILGSMTPDLDEKILQAREIGEVLLTTAITETDHKIKELESRSREMDEQAHHLDEKAQQVQARCQSLLDEVMKELDSRSRETLDQLKESTAILNLMNPVVDEKIHQVRETGEALLTSAISESDEKIKALEAKSRALNDQAHHLDEKALQVQERCHLLLNQVIDEADKKIQEIEGRARDLLENLVTRTEATIQESQDKGNHLLSDLIIESDKQRSINELWTQGKQAEQNRDLDLAIQCWEDLLRIEPGYYRAHNSLGSCLARLAGKKFGPESVRLLEQACGHFEQAVAMKPDYAEALNNWGIVLKNLARTKEPKEADLLLAHACEKYKMSLSIKPDNHEAMNNWGVALLNRAQYKNEKEADTLLQEACQKYDMALEVKPDNYKTLHNWGNALLKMARHKTGRQKDKLLHQAREKYLAAENLKQGISAYNLACIGALQVVEDECRKWLKIGEKKGTLEIREKALQDDVFAGISDKDWFKTIRWKGE